MVESQLGYRNSLLLIHWTLLQNWEVSSLACKSYHGSHHRNLILHDNLFSPCLQLKRKPYLGLVFRCLVSLLHLKVEWSSSGLCPFCGCNVSKINHADNRTHTSFLSRRSMSLPTVPSTVGRHSSQSLKYSKNGQYMPVPNPSHTSL